MKASSLAKAQKLCHDVKACAFQVATLIRTAQNAMDAGDYDAAAAAMASAADWALAVKRAAEGKAALRSLAGAK